MLTFITGVSFFVVGAYVLTWPAMRLSPRNRKRQAMIHVGVSLFALAQAFAPDPALDEDEESAPKSA